MTIAIPQPTPARDKVIQLARQWRPKNKARAPVWKKEHAALLVEQVAFWHGITVREVMGRGRSWAVVAARFDAIAAVYVNCSIAGRKYRQTELGRLFDRDHATIIQALKQRGLHE